MQSAERIAMATPYEITTVFLLDLYHTKNLIARIPSNAEDRA
jgi:hypothetical protein